MIRRTEDSSDTAALLLLKSRAARGMPCPCNDAIAAAIGRRGPASGASALRRLERSGAITIERAHGWRTVTITEFGLTTQGEDA
ncbi:hypothetical protein [Novosphingobium sp. PY1]|uniref:Uncharacterized protein n=1 Tax=Ochrobactrum sp. PW1 TaxID=1882222 RepID=A0A292GSE0_9HYPH|nr:hypothetical protein [Novosphingobium sp. PY1]BBA74396.1 hypothetical protein [Ochrobactrum sp. PW1]GFM29245.1 uncharacterized protein PY1_contig-07-171 [Novosphingobium sp. PY1]